MDTSSLCKKLCKPNVHRKYKDELQLTVEWICKNSKWSLYGENHGGELVSRAGSTLNSWIPLSMSQY